MYAFLADALVGLHLGIVLFMALGFLGILVGWPRGWRWIRNPWFRWPHLGIMAYVVGSALSDSRCFLTHWEDGLRQRAGMAHDTGASFVERLLHDILYFDVPLLWLHRAYYLIGALFVLQWVFVRPSSFRRSAPKRPEEPGPPLDRTQ